MEKPLIEEVPLRVFGGRISSPFQCFLRGVGEMGFDFIEAVEAASSDIKDTLGCSMPWSNDTLGWPSQSKSSEGITAYASPIEGDSVRLPPQLQDDMGPCHNIWCPIQIPRGCGQSAFGRVIVAREPVDAVGMYTLWLSLLRATSGVTPNHLVAPLLKISHPFGWQNSPWALWAFPGLGHAASVVVLLIISGVGVGTLLVLLAGLKTRPPPPPEASPSAAAVIGRNVVSFPRVMAPKRKCRPNQ